MDPCRLLVLTFVITAVYDLLLQVVCHNFDRMPRFIQWFDFIPSLKPYFEKHTILSAALIAGFVGILAQYVILKIQPFPKTLSQFVPFLGITFVVSALIGLPMQYSGLFPILNETYYRYLGTLRGLYHDGISGLIVQITLFVVLNGIKFTSR